MDITQIIILIVIIIVAIVLVLIGIQLIYILKEARLTLKRTDKILSNVEYLSNGLTHSTTTVENLITSLQGGVQVVGLVTKLINAITQKKDS